MKYRVVKFPMIRKGGEQQTQTERPLLDDDDGDLMPPPHSVSDFDRSEKVPDRLAEQPKLRVKPVLLASVPMKV